MPRQMQGMVESDLIRAVIQGLIIFWIFVWCSRAAWRNIITGETNRIARGVLFLLPPVGIIKFIGGEDLPAFFSGLL